MARLFSWTLVDTFAIFRCEIYHFKVRFAKIRCACYFDKFSERRYVPIRCDFGMGRDRFFFLRNSFSFYAQNRTLPKESFADVRKRSVRTISPIRGMVRFFSFANLGNFLMNRIPTYTRRPAHPASTFVNDFWTTDPSRPDSRSGMLSLFFDRPVSRFSIFPIILLDFPKLFPALGVYKRLVTF